MHPHPPRNPSGLSYDEEPGSERVCDLAKVQHRHPSYIFCEVGLGAQILPYFSSYWFHSDTPILLTLKHGWSHTDNNDRHGQ